MFILNFIRYLRGYVKFRVRGLFIERFLNLSARDRIHIWEARKRDGEFTGKTLAGDYRRLRRHAKKTGVHMRVLEKRGIPFTRLKYRKRIGLLIGLALFLAFIFIMSRFIWRIEVSGNERVSEAEIISAIENIGVTHGVLRSSIDVRGAERRALLALDGLSWIALNIQGSTVHVAVRENDPPPVMIDPHMPCNVVASRSGQVMSMVVYNGQPLASVGDSVLEGDVIVSGITQDRLGQNLFRHARAKVTARVQHRITVEIQLNQTKYIETGEIRHRRFLHVFGWDLPLFWPRKIPQPYHVEREKSMLAVNGAAIPVGVFGEKYFLMDEVPVKYTENEAKILALNELALRQKLELDGAEILDKTSVGLLSGDVFTVTADYVCVMDIAREKEILKDDN